MGNMMAKPPVAASKKDSSAFHLLEFELEETNPRLENSSMSFGISARRPHNRADSLNSATSTITTAEDLDQKDSEVNSEETHSSFSSSYQPWAARQDKGLSMLVERTASIDKHRTMREGRRALGSESDRKRLPAAEIVNELNNLSKHRGSDSYGLL